METFTSADDILRPESFEPVPATANLDIHWTGTGERMKVVNSDQGFAGQYENATGTLTWSATNDDGYTFDTTNEPSDFNLTHAFTCHLRNGAFFHGGAEDE
jgi:outer membrane receptor protein involved in Fe transport